VTHAIAFGIFAALAAGCWFASVGLYRATLDDRELTRHPDFRSVSALVILGVTLTSFVQFPAGYLLGLVAWGRRRVLAVRLATSEGVIAVRLPGRHLVLGPTARPRRAGHDREMMRRPGIAR
jgi:hypothetical protein